MIAVTKMEGLHLLHKDNALWGWFAPFPWAAEEEWRRQIAWSTDGTRLSLRRSVGYFAWLARRCEVIQSFIQSIYPAQPSVQAVLLRAKNRNIAVLLAVLQADEPAQLPPRGRG